jgi:hypothetical protein
MATKTEIRRRIAAAREAAAVALNAFEYSRDPRNNRAHYLTHSIRKIDEAATELDAAREALSAELREVSTSRT